MAEAMACVNCVTTLNRLKPESGGAVLEVAGGFAAFAGAVSPMTQSIGVGMGTPVTTDDVDRIEAFYRERHAGANIHLCPLADANLAEILGARGYRTGEFTNMLVRLAPAAPLDYGPSSGVEVRAIDPSENDSWATIVLRGFMERDELTEPEIELGKLATADPEEVRFLATVDGQPAGGAGFWFRDGIAWLAGDSTLKSFRARGIHMSLLRARLRMAAEMGAELVAASTLPGSISQRNYERCGFQVMYTKVAMLKNLGD
jgi:GNAT superfamily N-acetyltransferase